MIRNVARRQGSLEEDGRGVSRSHPSFPKEQLGVSRQEPIFTFDWIRYEVHDCASRRRDAETNEHSFLLRANNQSQKGSRKLTFLVFFLQVLEYLDVTRDLFPRTHLSRVSVNVVGDELVATAGFPLNNELLPPESRQKTKGYVGV